MKEIAGDHKIKTTRRKTPTIANDRESKREEKKKGTMKEGEIQRNNSKGMIR